MSYRKRDPFDDPTYMDRDHHPALAYDNYAMYDNSVISGQSMWGKFHHSSSYRLKGVITLEPILTRTWNLGSCVKKQWNVGLSISLYAIQPWYFVIKKICLTFELRL